MDIKAFRGLSGTYNVRANERDRGTPRGVECLVQFLDNTQHKFNLDRRSKGQDLLDCVFKHLNLIETDFFGLKYLPQEQNVQENGIIVTPKKSNEINGSLKNINSLNKKNSSSNNSISNSLLTKSQSPNSYDNTQSSEASQSSSPSPRNDASPETPASSENHTLKNDTTPGCVKSNGDSTKDSHVGVGDLNNRTANRDSIKSSHSLKNLQKQKLQPHSRCSSKSINQTNRENHSSTLIEERWLDPTKSIRKQYKSNPPFKFYFRVKFYVSDPCKLADDTTRNHLYLQLRQDILNQRLTVPTCSAILLASYILQSEVGDYKRELSEENYASQFRLLPNQSEDINKKVIELHKQHKSLSSADAEYQFLEHAAKKLDCYGVEFCDAIDEDRDNVQIGVSSSGIVVFKDDKRMNQFSWAKIIKIMFKKKIFSIQLRREEGPTCDNFIEYNLLTNQACKSFWEECVAQHSFFRLHQPKSPPKKFFSFLNFGSKFQYNGKTEYQTMEESKKRAFSHFSRTPSKRYARITIPIGRPSWADSNNQDDKKIIDDAERCVNDENNGIDSNINDDSSVQKKSSTLQKQNKSLADSIADIKRGLEEKILTSDFDKLSRKKEDESLIESKLMENIDKNRYQDILPYDSTRVQLIDSMSGDYINASFVDMPVPSGGINRYIATQGPLSTTCDDFWQMIWEQNSSLIIMVTPLIESGRVKCHKYWPDEKEEKRYAQIIVQNMCEKSKTATINRSFQLVDVKSGEKRITTQIQYKAWPDHEVPKDCCDFLKLVNRVRKHRLSKPDDPIIVHCSAGIGRTGVLILMETAICFMEAGEPVYPVKILEDMRKQRAMLIQTKSQFEFVAGAICKVYDQRFHKKPRKQSKK